MLIAFTLAYATCLLLSLAMKRHFQQVWPTKTLSPHIQFLLRNGGWLLLIITIIYCAKLAGTAVGLVLALGIFSATACVVALLLQYAPKFVLPLAATIAALSFI